MDDKQLDQTIRDYYMKQELPVSSIQRILEQGKVQRELGPEEPEAAVQASESKPKSYWWRQIGTLAAAACLMVFLAVQFDKGRKAENPMFEVEEVAGVVASRHNTYHNFDFAVHSFEDVQSELKDLAFTVQPNVKHKLLSAYEVIGARYCQVQGQQTAHLQMRNRSTGVLCSLFVASLDGELESMKRANRLVDLEANKIDMWADSGRFYALVN